MGRRYGRNQRRAHRERIAELEQVAATARAQRARALSELAQARENAMRELVNAKPYVEEAMKRLGHELGRAMGPHFQPHVEKLMRANQDRRISSPITFDAAIRADDVTVSYIEGRIEPIVYRVALLNDLWRAA